jgi:hypothetical protein
MIETRAIQERDHRGILAVAEALPEWFDGDALSRGKVVGFIILFFQRAG